MAEEDIKYREKMEERILGGYKTLCRVEFMERCVGEEKKTKEE